LILTKKTILSNSVASAFTTKVNMNESYEQKVAREERQHIRGQVERLRKKLDIHLHQNTFDLQKQLDEVGRMNADISDLLRKLG